MIDVLDIITDILRIDSYAQTITVVMLAWALLLIHIAMDSKTFTALFAPGMAAGALLTFYAARMTGFSFTGYKDANTILLGLVGIILGFVATLLMLRLWQAILDRSRPINKEERDRSMEVASSKVPS